MDGSEGRCVWCWKMGWTTRTLKENMGNECSRQWGQQTQTQGGFFFIEGVSELMPGGTLTHVRQSLVIHMNPGDDFQGLARNRCLPKLTLDFAQPNPSLRVLLKTFGTQCTTFFFFLKKLTMIKKSIIYYILFKQPCKVVGITIFILETKVSETQND